MYYASGNYEAFARPRKPEGVESKSAYIIGTGLAALDVYKRQAYIPVLARMPIAAVHHSVAAVFIPRTVPLSLKITPLHKKPTPDIILLPTRNT